MTKLLKAGALCLAIVLVVWLITIWRWQSTGYAATTGDIVGQLFVLPRHWSMQYQPWFAPQGIAYTRCEAG